MTKAAERGSSSSAIEAQDVSRRFLFEVASPGSGVPHRGQQEPAGVVLLFANRSRVSNGARRSPRSPRHTIFNCTMTCPKGLNPKTMASLETVPARISLPVACGEIEPVE